MDDVGGDLTECRDAFGAPQRFPQREQLALAGGQLRIAERQVASRLVDPAVKRPVESFQLIEHLVQAGRDRAELVAPGQRRPRAQIPFPRLLHGPQDGAKRLSQQLTDREVDEDA